MKCIAIALLILVCTMLFAQQPATLAQQKMCAEQASKRFNEAFPTRPEHSTIWQYTSHYEPKANTCYIMFNIAEADEGIASHRYHVYDAFENRDYAAFLEVDSIVQWCYISRHSHDKEPCKTSAEFLQSVEKYFGVGR